jgi:hypothetical protein
MTNDTTVRRRRSARTLSSGVGHQDLGGRSRSKATTRASICRVTTATGSICTVHSHNVVTARMATTGGVQQQDFGQ